LTAGVIEIETTSRLSKSCGKEEQSTSPKNSPIIFNKKAQKKDNHKVTTSPRLIHLDMKQTNKNVAIDKLFHLN